jgi:hypothetical protein
VILKSEFPFFSPCLNNDFWPLFAYIFYRHLLLNRCLSPLMFWVRLPLRARCTTLYDKVCQWLAVVFSLSELSISNKKWTSFKGIVVYLFRRNYFNRVTGDILTDRIICVTLII